MKVKGLDGKLHSWYLVGYQPKLSDDRMRSSLHIQARELIKKVFTSEKLLEEVPLPGSGGLFGDFYLPQSKIMVEVHGRQHYEFVSHFHQNIQGFIASKKRDNNKADWCSLNGITLVVLPYNGDIEEWKKILTQ